MCNVQRCTCLVVAGLGCFWRFVVYRQCSACSSGFPDLVVWQVTLSKCTTAKLIFFACKKKINSWQTREASLSSAIKLNGSLFLETSGMMLLWLPWWEQDTFMKQWLWVCGFLCMPTIEQFRPSIKRVDCWANWCFNIETIVGAQRNTIHSKRQRGLFCLFLCVVSFCAPTMFSMSGLTSFYGFSIHLNCIES